MFTHFKSALNHAAAMLGLAGHDMFAYPAASYPRGYTFRPQSEASKKYHLDRAKAKRSRKAKINHDRVLRGEMDYSPAHLERTGTITLGKSEVHFDDKLIGTTKRVVMRPGTKSFDDMTVAELLDCGRERGIKVTTKMTKAKLIEALNAAL